MRRNTLSNRDGNVSGQKEKMKRSSGTKIFLIVLAVLAICYMSYFILYPWKSTDFYMHTKVENVLGFAVNNTTLEFGTIPPGAWGTKIITISYNEPSPEFVRIVVTGNISQWTSVSDNNFILQGSGEKPLGVRIYMPKDAEIGEYTGTLSIYYKKLY